jgi:3'-phosphoadenosine 5'-phosphosulfate (PAPS) 3'-phosphatase
VRLQCLLCSICQNSAVGTYYRKRKDKAAGQLVSRGAGVRLKDLKDKKLKGQLTQSEKVIRQAEQTTKKINEYLLPDDAGQLEAEGARQLLALD